MKRNSIRPTRLAACNEQETELDASFPPIESSDTARISILPVIAGAGIADTGRIFEVPYTRLDLPEGCCRLMQHTRIVERAPLALAIDIVNIDGSRTSLELPSEVNRRLLTYLERTPKERSEISKAVRPFAPRLEGGFPKGQQLERS